MKKTCTICGKQFDSSTNSPYCADECRIKGRNNKNALKAKKYRDAHNHEEIFRTKKRGYDKKPLNCSNCKQDYVIVQRGKKTDMCDKCYMESSLKCTDMAKRGKSKANTTGLIGVYVLKKTWGGKGVWGVLSLIDHNRLTIFRNKYKDEELHEKTFIQAAVDRDIFIMQNDLPHTRNFTDDELEAKMFYLGYEELKNLQFTQKNINSMMYKYIVKEESLNGRA